MELFTDTWELAAYAGFVLAWAVALCAACSYGCLYKRIREEKEKAADTLTAEGVAERPPLTVVITAHNQADQLRRNLPAILEQDYDTFEVVVVNNGSTDETEDVLKELELKYARLTHRITPKSARYISPKRLSLTLGFRAARYDWVVLTEANCRPDSALWLAAIGRKCSESPACQILLGYANYLPSPTLFARRIIFFRLYNLLMLFAHSTKRPAYRADSANMAFRKSLFLQANGFAGHVNLINGAEELLVNRNSTRANTALALHPDAYVRQELPPAKRLWKQERVYYMETRKQFRHTLLFRLKYGLKALLPWCCLLTFAGATALSLLHRNYIMAGAGGTQFLIYMIVRDVAFNRSARALGERSYHLLLPFLELAVPLWDLSAWLAHKTHPRSDFRKKII